MIYTLTCNPAMDYIIRTDKLVFGEINRTYGEKISVGGKGINVSTVLKSLGVDSVAMGYIAGFTGDYVLRVLEERGIRTDFIRVEGMTRINVIHLNGKETEFNGSGPRIEFEATRQQAVKIAALPEKAWLVIAGSVPGGLPGDYYARLLAQAGRSDLKVIADTAGPSLFNILPTRPYLVKPNLKELGQIFGVTLRTRTETEHYARLLCSMGARNVIVSMGSYGACMVTEEGECLFVPAFIGKTVNTVGAGDSLLAGYLAAKTEGRTDLEALRQGVAAGCATAFRTGLAEKEDIDALLHHI